MNLIDFGITVALPALTGGGAGWALVHFFGQRIVEHRLTKDLERYREELKENTEVLKSQLSIYAHEQSVAISRVDTQRSEAIRNIYACVRNVINPVSSIAAGSPIQNGTPTHSAQYYFVRAQEAQDAIGVLSNKLADAAIYFDSHTYLKIMTFVRAAMGTTGVYLDSMSPLVAKSEPAEKVLAIAEQGRPLVKENFESTMKPAAAELIGIFRVQLGIEQPIAAALPK
jgi:hypothetical protein